MRLLSLILLLAIFVGLVVLFARLAKRAWAKSDHRVLRRALVVFGALLFLYWVALPVTMAIVATRGPAESAVDLDLGPRTQQIGIETADGLTLTASYSPPRNGAAVITYPSREWTAAESKMLAEAGFGVLALDMRGYGGSEGHRNAFGWRSTPDIDAAVDFLDDQTAVKSIGGFGQSVGGEQMIEAAASNEQIKAVVSEGAGERSFREMLIRGPAAALAIPQSLVLTGSVALLTGDAPPAALDQLAGEISPRALMLINGTEGNAGEELNVDYFAAAGEPKELWTIENGGHTSGLADAADEYPKRVKAFFEEHLMSAPTD